MKPKSPTKIKAIKEATKMFLENCPKKEVVAFLTAKYLYSHSDAYTIAMGAEYASRHPDLHKEVLSVHDQGANDEADMKAGYGDVKMVVEDD